MTEQEAINRPSELAPIYNNPLGTIETILEEIEDGYFGERASHLHSLFEAKVAFLRGKLAHQVFGERNWNPVIGLGRLSPYWDSDHPIHDFLHQFIQDAQMDTTSDNSYIEYSKKDSALPGLRYASYELSVLPTFQIGDGEYRFAYRQYKVVDPDEISQSPQHLQYEVGPKDCVS